MLNEDKIRLMTGIAMFEKKEGRRIFPLNRYFKGDYISAHIIRSFISYTFCFLLLSAVWVLYQMDRLINAVGLDILFGYGKRALALYLSGLFVYLALTWRIYSERYDYARRGMKIYKAKMRRLDRQYEPQDRGTRNW